MKIGNLEISTEELNALDEQGAKNISILSAVKGTSKGVRKPSINGAKKDLEDVRVTEENGRIYFRHDEYKTRSKPVADLVEAKGKFEAKQIADTNKRTGTDFVSVNEQVVGENLVILAEQHNFL